MYYMLYRISLILQLKNKSERKQEYDLSWHIQPGEENSWEACKRAWESFYKDM